MRIDYKVILISEDPKISLLIADLDSKGFKSISASNRHMFSLSNLQNVGYICIAVHEYLISFESLIVLPLGGKS